MKKNTKTTVRCIIVYIVLNVGLLMFLYAYTNSYNKMNSEKIVPAMLTVSGEKANLEIIGEKTELDLEFFQPESKLFLVLYLISDIELRAETAVLTRITGVLRYNLNAMSFPHKSCSVHRHNTAQRQEIYENRREYTVKTIFQAVCRFFLLYMPRTGSRQSFFPVTSQYSDTEVQDLRYYTNIPCGYYRNAI